MSLKYVRKGFESFPDTFNHFSMQILHRFLFQNLWHTHSNTLRKKKTMFFSLAQMLPFGCFVGRQSSFNKPFSCDHKIIATEFSLADFLNHKQKPVHDCDICPLNLVQKHQAQATK